MTLARIFWLFCVVMLAVASLGNKFYISYGLAILAGLAVVLPLYRFPELRGQQIGTIIRLFLTVVAVVAFAVQAV
jgi:hypothetical protein